MKPKIFKFATLLGIIEPVFYFALITALSLGRENYSIARNYISELSGIDAPHRKPTNFASFMILGAAVIMFGFALRQATEDGKFSKLANAFMAVSGASLMALALVPADGDKPTARGKWHRRLTGPPAIGIPMAMACYYFIFKSDPRWRTHWPRLTLLSGAFMLAGDWLLYIRQPKRLIGLAQRLTMGIALLWMMLASAKIYKLQFGR